METKLQVIQFKLLQGNLKILSKVLNIFLM